MTDKIIIDGVDVSEWTLKEIEYHLQHKPKLQRFRAYADIYKRHQRKEQECKELETILKVKNKEYNELVKNATAIQDRYWRNRQALDKIENIAIFFINNLEIKSSYKDWVNIQNIINEVKNV